jgi:hypothetical protein
MFCLAALPAQGQPTVDASVYGSMDRLVGDMQLRAASRMGRADDFQITPTEAAYPLGTLLRAGTTIPIDYEACKPAKEPPAVPLPSLFPRYELTRKAAVEFGILPQLAEKLFNLTAKASDTDTVELSVQGTKMRTLADTDLARAFERAECASLLRRHKAWLVRGAISGQRKFLLKNVDAQELKGGLSKVFGFSAEAGPGSRTTELKDTEETVFLQIVSAIAPAPGGRPSLVSPTVPVDHPAEREPLPIDAPTGSIPAPTGPIVRVVTVVRPEAKRPGVIDNSPLQQHLFFELRTPGTQWNTVLVPERRLQPTAEVRYFHDADQDEAMQLWEGVRAHEPQARLLRMRLAIPPGSFEVWLPRAPG